MFYHRLTCLAVLLTPGPEIYSPGVFFLHQIIKNILLVPTGAINKFILRCNNFRMSVRTHVPRRPCLSLCGIFLKCFLQELCGDPGHNWVLFPTQYNRLLLLWDNQVDLRFQGIFLLTFEISAFSKERTKKLWTSSIG